MTTVWEAQAVNEPDVDAYLKEGWEPLAGQILTGQGRDGFVWFLRRRVPQPQAVKDPERLPTLSGGVERPRWDDE